MRIPIAPPLEYEVGFGAEAAKVAAAVPFTYRVPAVELMVTVKCVHTPAGNAISQVYTWL